MAVPESQIGVLYVCATPIGNLEDITLRVLRILQEVDIIAAEDTRQTRKLLSHFDIHTPVTSYHEHNRLEKGPWLVGKLCSGSRVALVSDAGTPAISDPGQELVRQALEAGVPVVPLPGPSAVLAALVVSGYSTERFVFEGFVPRGKSDKEAFLQRIGREPRTTVLYEAPHRLLDTLSVCRKIMPRRELAVCRELTKVHEEVKRGTAAQLYNYFAKERPRGECVLVLAPLPEGKTMESECEETDEATGSPLSLKEAVLRLMAAGYDKKTAIKEVARRQKVSKREVYAAVINIPARHSQGLRE